MSSEKQRKIKEVRRSAPRGKSREGHSCEKLRKSKAEVSKETERQSVGQTSITQQRRGTDRYRIVRDKRYFKEVFTMNFKTTDMELMSKASQLLNYEEYTRTREKYMIRNPKRYVSAHTHRRIMQEAVEIGKTIMDRGGTDEEVRNACLYHYICIDARKYRLDWNRARKDLQIDNMMQKYGTDISEA